MRTVRILASLAVAALGLLVLPTAATAEPYPIGTPLLTVDRPTIIVGETVTVFGSGYGANDTVTVTTVTNTALRPAGSAMVPVAYEAAQRRAAVVVIADANGDFSVQLTLDQIGNVVITASGLPSGSVASVTVRVLPRGLPVTGQNGGPLRIALIGSAVAAVGVVLVVLVRSRRRRAGIHSA
jgi:hypothetical protein